MSFNLGDIYVTLKAKTEGLEKGLSKFEGQIQKIQHTSTQLSDKMAGLGRVARVGALAAGAGFVELGRRGVNAAADFERMGVALNTAFEGNTEAAKQAQDSITNFTARTPFQIGEVTDSFLKLKNFGLDPSERALTSYGDTASSMGKGLEQMVEAVADATTGEFERLKEFGIKSSQQGDRVKFTFKGVETEVGKNAEEIQDYLINLGETNFAGGMEAQSKTLGGLLSTLSDNFSISLANIATSSGVFDVVKGAVEGVIEKIGEFNTFINEGGNVMEALRTKIEDHPLGSFLLPKLISLGEWVVENKDSVLGFLKGAAMAIGGLLIITQVSAAISSLVAFMNPVGIAITAIVVVVGLLYTAWTNNWGGIQDKTKAAVDFLKDLWDKLSAGASDLYQNKLNPAFEKIKEIAGIAFQGIQGFWEEYLKPTIDNIGIVLGLLKRSFETNMKVAWFVAKVAFELIKRYWETSLRPAFEAIDRGLVVVVGLFRDNWDSIKRIVSGAFDVLKGIFKIGLGVIKLIIAPFVAAFTGDWRKGLNIMKDAASNIFSGVAQIVRGIFGGIAGYLQFQWNSIVASLQGKYNAIKNAIIAPFKDAIGKVSEYAQKIKDKLDKINPFHRESPSLVDWVEMGTEKIASLYGGLQENLQQTSLPVTGMFDGERTLAGIGSGVGAVSNSNVTVNNNIDASISDQSDANMLAEVLAFKFRSL